MWAKARNLREVRQIDADAAAAAAEHDAGRGCTRTDRLERWARFGDFYLGTFAQAVPVREVPGALAASFSQCRGPTCGNDFATFLRSSEQSSCCSAACQCSSCWLFSHRALVGNYLFARRKRLQMIHAGRFLPLHDLMTRIADEGGTLIIEAPSLGWRVTDAWWTTGRSAQPCTLSTARRCGI